MYKLIFYEDKRGFSETAELRLCLKDYQERKG